MDSLLCTVVGSFVSFGPSTLVLRLEFRNPKKTIRGLIFFEVGRLYGRRFS